MRQSQLIIAAVLTALLGIQSACTNRNYVDLMRVTGETESNIEYQNSIYEGSGPLPERIDARNRIVKLRQKQMIMAQRINIGTMPEVKSGAMTAKEGEAKKAELVAAATARYEAAKALPIPAK